MIGALVLALAMSVAAPAQDEGDIRQGRLLSIEKCSACHAVGVRGVSPMPDALAFRSLHEKYAVEGLGEALAEGISTGDSRMPEHVLEAQEIADLIAYLKSLERPNRRRSR